MSPAQALVSSGFALAEPGQRYLVYLPSGGTVDVAVAAGTYAVSWLDPADPTHVTPGGSTSTGQGLAAPTTGDWVLHLVRSGGAPAQQPVDLISATTFAGQSAGWSTASGRTVERAHDGSTTTEAWADTDAEVWLEHDLGGRYALSSARVYDDNSGAHEIGRWKLQYHDGSAWVDAFPLVAANTVGWNQATLTGITTTRVRVVCQAPAGLLLELREFECYGTPAGSAVPVIDVAINFQPTGAPTVAGYLVDSGAVFADRGNGFQYGWNAPTDYARDRNLLADQRLDTFNHMQKPGAGSAWEIVVPNGAYEVVLLCGDPAYNDSVYKVAIEGIVVLDAVPSTSQRHIEVTVTVQVSDGRLTVGNAAGAVNNKIGSIAIHSLPGGSG